MPEILQKLLYFLLLTSRGCLLAPSLRLMEDVLRASSRSWWKDDVGNGVLQGRSSPCCVLSSLYSFSLNNDAGGLYFITGIAMLVDGGRVLNAG